MTDATLREAFQHVLREIADAPLDQAESFPNGYSSGWNDFQVHVTAVLTDALNRFEISKPDVVGLLQETYILADPLATCDPECPWCKSQLGPRQYACDGACCWPSPSNIVQTQSHTYVGAGAPVRCKAIVTRLDDEDGQSVRAKCRLPQGHELHESEALIAIEGMGMR